MGAIWLSEYPAVIRKTPAITTKVKPTIRVEFSAQTWRPRTITATCSTMRTKPNTKTPKLRVSSLELRPDPIATYAIPWPADGFGSVAVGEDVGGDADVFAADDGDGLALWAAAGLSAVNAVGAAYSSFKRPSSAKASSSAALRRRSSAMRSGYSGADVTRSVADESPACAEWD